MSVRLIRTLKRGFTLLELVFGIAVLSIVLLLMTGALFPQAEKGTDPWFQVRSAELAQSLMNEILARRYDENSLVIDNLRCDEVGAGACATVLQLADCDTTEESDREFYDDVDDFNCLDTNGADVITNIEGTDLSGVYEQFNVQVIVTYDSTFVNNAKLITITVTPPRGADVIYSSFKANY